MDTMGSCAPHGVALSVDTVTSSIISPQGVFVVCSHHPTGVVFLLAPHRGGVTVCEVSTAANKGMMQRVWQGLMSSRLATVILIHHGIWSIIYYLTD